MIYKTQKNALSSGIAALSPNLFVINILVKDQLGEEVDLFMLDTFEDQKSAYAYLLQLATEKADELLYIDTKDGVWSEDVSDAHVFNVEYPTQYRGLSHQENGLFSASADDDSNSLKNTP